MKAKSYLLGGLCWGAAFLGPATASEMEAGFREPRDEARPRAYWNWLNGAVSLSALTRT